MEIVTCRDWSAIPRDNASLPRSPAQGVVIHHMASPNVDVPAGEAMAHAKQLARSVQQSHLGRGWRDSGQHFSVTRTGIVLEGRNGSLVAAQKGMVLQGAHAGNNDANRTLFGIECEGTYTDAAMPGELWAALVELCAQLALWGRFQAVAIYPHSHFRPTECPGAWTRAHLEALAAAVKERKISMLEVALRELTKTLHPPKEE